MNHRKLTPVELASSSKAKAEPATFSPKIGPVEPLSEETRWDALRAVTWSHQHVAPIEPHHGDAPLSGVREVIEMLGLAGVEKRTEGMPEPIERDVLLAAVDHPERAIRCPECNAPPGSVCMTVHASRSLPYPRGHVERQRRAERQS